jgi:hypothetical protein
LFLKKIKIGELLVFPTHNSQLTTYDLRFFERRSKCPEETEWCSPREAGAELEEDADRDAAGAEEERAA